jgi:hypothetical protein
VCYGYLNLVIVKLKWRVQSSADCGEILVGKDIFFILLILLFFSGNTASADAPWGATERSLHLGLFHPNGVDVLGFSVEQQINSNEYWFYNVGIPSFAAVGYSYYQHHAESGFLLTTGVGIGFVLYGSLAYQWLIKPQHLLKLGAVWATGVAYTGALPVVSYEYRFAK